MKKLQPKPASKPITPVEFMAAISPEFQLLFGGRAELDFSWAKQAVMIHDMRHPAAVRTSSFYTADEIASGGWRNGWIAKASDFMARG